MRYAESIAELKDEDFVVFWFSLEEDAFIGHHKECNYKIYMYRWKDIPHVPVMVHGHWVRCVTVADLEKSHTVATPFVKREKMTERVQ